MKRGNCKTHKYIEVLFIIGFCFGLVFISACARQDAVYQPAVAKLIEKASEFKNVQQPEQAICRLESAADIAPETFQVQYNLGVLYYDSKKWQKAIEHLEKALAMSPDQSNILYTLGFAYESFGDELRAKIGDVSDKNRLDTVTSEALRQSKEAYQKALSIYSQFLKVAPSSDPGRREVEEEQTYLQAKIKKVF